jgi:hypothetical protein
MSVDRDFGRRPQRTTTAPNRDDVQRQRHLEILEALNRMTRVLSHSLEEIRDELRRQR